MNNQKIKIEAWEKIKNYINLNDEGFNSSDCSFKISHDYNLVVWCDIDYEENNERYYIVSIRYNPYDDNFGDYISHLEYSTQNTSKEELEKAIDILLNSLKGKELVKGKYGNYELR